MGLELSGLNPLDDGPVCNMAVVGHLSCSKGCCHAVLRFFPVGVTYSFLFSSAVISTSMKNACLDAWQQYTTLVSAVRDNRSFELQQALLRHDQPIS